MTTVPHELSLMRGKYDLYARKHWPQDSVGPSLAVIFVKRQDWIVHEHKGEPHRVLIQQPSLSSCHGA
jgi:hypothetical protein